MNKIKTAELTGATLNWAVAKIEAPDLTTKAFRLFNVEGPAGLYSWSTDWSQGGPIIEREQIDLKYCGYDNPPFWGAVKFSPSRYDRRGAVGPTALVAAMRCFVASRLGDEVEIPSEL